MLLFVFYDFDCFEAEKCFLDLIGKKKPREVRNRVISEIINYCRMGPTLFVRFSFKSNFNADFFLINNLYPPVFTFHF